MTYFIVDSKVTDTYLRIFNFLLILRLSPQGRCHVFKNEGAKSSKVPKKVGGPQVYIYYCLAQKVEGSLEFEINRFQIKV